MDVFDGGRAGGVLLPLGVGLADRQAAAEAAAGEGHAEALGPVVAAAGEVHLGRPAELAAADDDRPVEQAAPGQVAQEGGEGRVELLGAVAVDLVVVDVRVPAAERHLDAADADLDEPAGGEAAAAEGGVAVLGADARPARCDTSNAFSCSEDIITRARAMVSRCSVASTPRRRPRAKARSTTSRSLDPRQLARPGRGRRHVGQAALRVVHLEGVELVAEEPAAARPLAGQDRDVPGDVRPVDGQLVAADRPDRGVLDRRVGAVAGLHHVRPALVVALLAHQRSDEGDRAHLVGQPLVPLGELDALDGGRDRLRPAGGPGPGVRVERLELARPAGHPEQDDRPRRLARALGLRGEQVPDRRQPAQPGQREEASAVDLHPVRSVMSRLARPSGPQWFQENSVELSRVQ